MIEPGENRMAGGDGGRIDVWSLYRSEGGRTWFDGDELVEGRRPGVRWEPRNGRFELRLPDGTLVAWAPNPDGGPGWRLAVARPPALKVVREEEPAKPPPDHRALVDAAGQLAVPWSEMTPEEKRLAIRTGLVVLKKPERRPLSQSTIEHQARERAREEAAMRLDKDPAFGAWVEDRRQAARTPEALAARRDYAAWYERRFRRSLPGYRGDEDSFDRMFR